MGESVSVKVPRIDRTSTDISRIVYVVVEVLGKAKYLYRMQCKSGILSGCFNAKDLEPFCGRFEIPVHGW